jgi:hypothetical protein
LFERALPLRPPECFQAEHADRPMRGARHCARQVIEVLDRLG